MSRVGVFFAWAGAALWDAWAWLDGVLVRLAGPFGVRVADPARRYSLLLVVYGVIYVVGALPLPVLPLLALGVGYLGVVAVGRAWVANEMARERLAKRLDDGDPDQMPDLRGLALASAVQLLFLFPLIFLQAQRHFNLYRVADDSNFGTWVLFTVDSYNKAFLGLLQLYGWHPERIQPATSWGRHLVLVSRLTFDLLLIQAVIRLFTIRQTVYDAAQAVVRDPEMAARVGSRVVPALLLRLEEDDPAARRAAAGVLGGLHDYRAVEPLLHALRRDADAQVRARAARSLGQLAAPAGVPALIAALRDGDDGVRAAAAEALAHVGSPEALKALREALDGADPSVRARAAGALAARGSEEDLDRLVGLPLRDPDEGVRAAAVRALQGRHAERAVGRLAEVLEGQQAGSGWLGWLMGTGKSTQEMDQEVHDRVRAAEALGAFGGVRALEALLRGLKNPQRLVRKAAAASLGKVRGSRAVAALAAALKDKQPDVRRAVAAALGAAGDRAALAAVLQAWREDRDGEVRLAAAQTAVALDPEAARAAGVA